MGILESLLANSLSDSPQSFGNVLAKQFNATVGSNSQSNGTSAGAGIPKTTTIDQDADGNVTVTKQQKLTPDQVQQAQQGQQFQVASANPQQQYVNLANSAGPNVAYVPPVAVAPNTTQAGNASTQVPPAQAAGAIAQQPNVGPVAPQVPGTQGAAPGVSPQVAQAASGQGQGAVAPGAPSQDQTPPTPNNKYLNPALTSQILNQYGVQPGANTGGSDEESAIHHMVLNSPMDDKSLQAIGYGAYSPDGALDTATKKAYNDEFAQRLEARKGIQDAEKRTDELIRGGGVGLQRALKDPSEDGSYLKAYLYQRLGLSDLAKLEQQKLGAGSQWAQTLVNGKPAWVKYNGQGAPVKGYTQDGEMTGNELVNTIGMKGAETHTQTYKDRDTGQLYQLQTTPLGPRYMGSNGQVFSGDTSKLYAYGIGSDMDVKNQIDINRVRNKIAGMPLETAVKVIAEDEAKNGPMDPAVKQQLLQQAQGTSGAYGGFTPVNTGGRVPGAVPPGTNAPAGTPAAPGQSLKRNNNPGNIMDGDFAKKQPGYLGTAPNGTAIFDSTDSGEQAQSALLGSKYGNMKLNDIPATWAPAGHGDNDPVKYRNQLQKITGFDDATMTKTYSQLSDSEKQRFRDAQRQIEHFGGTGATSTANTPPTTTEGTAMRPRSDFRTQAEYDAYKKSWSAANEKIAGKSAETVAGAGLMANTIDNAEHAKEIIDSGSHNFGPLIAGTLHGRGPIGRAIGTEFETEGQRNTRTVMDTVRQIGGAMSQDAIKGHLSNQELQFFTENKPTESSDPQYVKSWLDKAVKRLQDIQKYAEPQARTGGTANNPVTNRQGPVAPQSDVRNRADAIIGH